MIGIDIIEIERIERSIEKHGDHFLKKLFTDNELAADMPLQSIAGRFAAKEAIAKALGTGFGEDLAWHDIEITSDDKGAPKVSLNKKAAERFNNPQLHISISHCKTYATAIAIKS